MRTSAAINSSPPPSTTVSRARCNDSAASRRLSRLRTRGRGDDLAIRRSAGRGIAARKPGRNARSPRSPTLLVDSSHTSHVTHRWSNFTSTGRFRPHDDPGRPAGGPAVRAPRRSARECASRQTARRGPAAIARPSRPGLLAECLRGDVRLDARRVDQFARHAAEIEPGGEIVAGRAGDGPKRWPRRAGQGVEQAALAGVGPADEHHADRFATLRRG